MIELKLTQEFPAGLDRLWAAFGRPDCPVKKYLALGAAAVRTVRFNASAQTIDAELELELDVPIDPRRLPSWARWQAGHLQTLRHRSTWRRASPTRVTAELHIVPLRLPVQAHAPGTITESSAGASRAVLTWRVSSDLPLVGALIVRPAQTARRGAAAGSTRSSA